MQKKKWPNSWPKISYTLKQFENAKRADNAISNDFKQNRGQQEIYAKNRPVHENFDFPIRRFTR